jgi:hypothetical protein
MPIPRHHYDYAGMIGDDICALAMEIEDKATMFEAVGLAQSEPKLAEALAKLEQGRRLLYQAAGEIAAAMLATDQSMRTVNRVPC